MSRKGKRRFWIAIGVIVGVFVLGAVLFGAGVSFSVLELLDAAAAIASAVGWG